VARAKRTDRAEARRRHRAITVEPLAEGDDGAGGADESPTTQRAGAAAGPRTRSALSAPAGGSSAAPQRPGVIAAFTSSFRPVDLRSDLRLLPRLLLHRAFLAPTVASGVAFILFAYASGPFVILLYQYFSYQLPVASLFIAGFFAPRGSYLIGGVLGVVSFLFQAPLWINLPPDFAISGIVSGALAGALFASLAAWYRRFLNRANPNRNRPTTPTSRRPDGKVPRKPQQRPMLARRR